jgi:hypothetical protein
MTYDMIAAHRAFRQDVVRDYLRRLREHLSTEDELVWPRLLARLDLDADHVLRMEQQHKLLVAGLAEFEAAWEAHRRDLLAHFDEEERHVLPLIEEHLTVGERD